MQPLYNKSSRASVITGYSVDDAIMFKGEDTSPAILLSSTMDYNSLWTDQPDLPTKDAGNSTEDGHSGVLMSTHQIALTALLSLTFLVSLVGNSFVFLVICNTRSLRRLNNVLIVSLAAVDMTRTLLVIPMFVVGELVTWNMPLPSPLCSLYHGLHISCEIVAVYNLTAISIERVFVITQPLVYQRVITRTRITIFVSLLWVLGFLYGLLQILWFRPQTTGSSIMLVGQRKRTSLIKEEEEIIVCEYRPTLGYAIFDFTICLVLPLVVMIVCYIKIFCVVQSQINRIAPSTSTVLDQSDITTYHAEHSREETLRRLSMDSNRSSLRTRLGRLPRGSHDSVCIANTLGRVVEAKGEDKLDSEYTGAKVEKWSPEGAVEEAQQSLGNHLSKILDKSDSGVDTEVQQENSGTNGTDIDNAEERDSKNSSSQEEDRVNSSQSKDNRKISTVSARGVCLTEASSALSLDRGADEGCLQIKPTYTPPEIIIRVEGLASSVSTPAIPSMNVDSPKMDTRRTRSPTIAWDTLSPDGLSSEERKKSARSLSNPEVKALSASQCSVFNLQSVLKRSNAEKPKDSYLQNKRGSVTFNLSDESETEDREHRPERSRLGVPNLRVVTMDDDTNFSSEATTTDTSLSGSGHSPHLPNRIRRFSNSHLLSQQYSNTSVSAPLSQSSRINSMSLTSIASSGRSRIFRLSENKAIKMTAIVVGAFMLCWMPYNISFLVKQVNRELMGIMTWNIVSALVFLSSAVNPFIYNFYSSEFRRALRRIITCKDKKNIPWA